MPLQNPFSPSRIRRRLSRETLDSDKTSPERGGKFGCRSAAFQLDDEASPSLENRPSPSRSKKRSNRVEDQKGFSSPTRNSHTIPKSSERRKDTPTTGTLQSSPRCDVREIAAVVSPALPYSKDFGSFDLTLCEADDGRCVVLVEYEDRVFLNGKQIYITLDGRVTDRDGIQDDVLQCSYDCVLQEKRRSRKTARATSTKKDNNGGPRRGKARSICRDDETDIAPSRLSRANKHAARNDDRPDILTEMADIEGSFSDIIARLCEAILKQSKRGKNRRQPGDQQDGHSYEKISSHVNATLDRLIDQFQSVVELSASIDEDGDEARNVDGDDEAMIEKWVAEAFNDKDGEKKGKQNDKPKKEGGQTSKSTRKASGLRTVGTQIKERRVEKRDKGGQTELIKELVEKFDRSEQTEKRFTGMTVEEKLLRELREENRLLQGEIFALESEMREMQEQQQELEKRFEEETAAKLAVMKELAEMVGSKTKNRDGSTNTVTRIGDNTGEELVSTRKNEATSTTFIAKCTISSTSINSLSSVTSSESETAIVEEATEPGVGMRQRSRALKSEIGRLRNVYSDVEEQISKLAEENTNLRLRMGKLNREAKDTKNHMEQTDLACEEYRREIKNLDKVNALLEKKLAEMSKEKLFVGEKLDAANDELTKLDVDRRRAERELAEVHKKLENLTREKQRLSEEFGKLEKSHLEVSTKSAKLSKISAESEVQLGVLRGQIGDMTIETNQLCGENQANSDARQRAERENRKMESELKATRRMNGELSGEVLQIRSKIGALEDAVRHLESDNAQLMQKNVHLEAGKEAFARRASDAEASNQMMSASLKDYEAELYRIKRENFELRTTVEQMNMINTSIRSRLDNWGKDSVDIGKRMKQIVGVKTELQSFIQQLNSVNTNIEERFEKMDSEYADLERKLQVVGKEDKGGEEAGDVCGAQGKSSLVLLEID